MTLKSILKFILKPSHAALSALCSPFCSITHCKAHPENMKTQNTHTTGPITHEQNVERLASIAALVLAKAGLADDSVRGLIDMVARGQPLSGEESYRLMSFANSINGGSSPWAQVAWVARMVDTDRDEPDADIAYTELALQHLGLSMGFKLGGTP
jgi:hypothetical protein